MNSLQGKYRIGFTSFSSSMGLVGREAVAATARMSGNGCLAGLSRANFSGMNLQQSDWLGRVR